MRLLPLQGQVYKKTLAELALAFDWLISIGDHTNISAIRDLHYQ